MKKNICLWQSVCTLCPITSPIPSPSRSINKTTAPVPCAPVEYRSYRRWRQRYRSCPIDKNALNSTIHQANSGIKGRKKNNWSNWAFRYDHYEWISAVQTPDSAHWNRRQRQSYQHSMHPTIRSSFIPSAWRRNFIIIIIYTIFSQSFAPVITFLYAN